MTLYVIDASVAARFLLIEELSNEGRVILEKFMKLGILY
jgi:hypothetical protein